MTINFTIKMKIDFLCNYKTRKCDINVRVYFILKEATRG